MPSSFETTGGVSQGCSGSPFLFNFVVNEVVEDALDLQNVGVELGSGKKQHDVDFLMTQTTLNPCSNLWNMRNVQG